MLNDLVRRTAECDVDQTVSAADAPLHPYCEWWEDDGYNAKEDVAAAHVCLGFAAPVSDVYGRRSSRWS